MWNLVTRIWQGFIGVLAILLPFGKGLSFPRMGPGLRWTLHVIILIAILVGLFFLNDLIEPYIRTDSLFFRETFLPIVFLLVYFLLWTGWSAIAGSP